MAAAQTEQENPLAARLMVLEDEIKDASEALAAKQQAIVNLQSAVEALTQANTALVSTNKQLVQDASLQRLDIYCMISKTARIQMTNKKANEVMTTIEQHPVMRDILVRQNLSAIQIQRLLDPLLATWSSAKHFGHFRPNAKNKGDFHCRPVFCFSDILPHLDEEMKNKISLSSLVWQYSMSMHVDVSAFHFLRPGTAHKTSLHAYLGVLSTLFLFNIYRENKINYPNNSPIFCAFSSAEYSNIMNVNPVDWSVDPEPVRSQNDIIDIHAQMSARKNKKKRKF